MVSDGDCKDPHGAQGGGSPSSEPRSGRLMAVALVESLGRKSSPAVLRLPSLAGPHLLPSNHLCNICLSQGFPRQAPLNSLQTHSPIWAQYTCPLQGTCLDQVGSYSPFVVKILEAALLWLVLCPQRVRQMQLIYKQRQASSRCPCSDPTSSRLGCSRKGQEGVYRLEGAGMGSQWLDHGRRGGGKPGGEGQGGKSKHT